MQKILILMTKGNDLRSSVEGISAEDGDLINKESHIGRSHDMVVPNYQTVMHAVADGWKLLAPPINCGLTENEAVRDLYDWWLVKD